MDNMFHSYKESTSVRDLAMEETFIKHTEWFSDKGRPYIVPCGKFLKEKLLSDQIYQGITGTAPGFYAPQGRSLRLAVQDEQLNNKLHTFEYNGLKITNLEMETSAIYGLSKLLGHQAVSLNVIIANRATTSFTKSTKEAVDKLIVFGLNQIAQNV